MTRPFSLIGSSKAIDGLRREAVRFLERIAHGRRPPGVLIEGERGVGKTHLAALFHTGGPRARGPFVDVNCAAIAETLAEAELFGYEKGAFTDAKTAKPGLFEQADGGVLFLDEIGALSTSLQAKLLTVIERPMVRRLGATTTRRVDVWIITATNTDLAEAAREGRFRPDLLDRLTEFVFTMPPLRDRDDDVLELARHFLEEACDDFKHARMMLTEDARRALLAYDWPGNVRELAKLMQRLAVLTEVREISADLLKLPVAGSLGRKSEMRPRSSRTRREYGKSTYTEQEILAALEASHWNLNAAANRLGVPRNTLRYWIERKYRLRPPDAGTMAFPGTASSPPRDDLPAAGAGGLRWERRLLCMLRLTVRVASDPAPLSLPVLEQVEDRVVGLEGRVEERSPLSLTLVFGVTPMEEPSTRATQAALAAVKLIERDPRTPPLGPQATAAIHFQACLIAHGRGGDQLSSDDKRTMLARLDDLDRGCPAGGIVVSPETARAIERRFRLSPLPGDPADPAGFLVEGVQPTPFDVGRYGRSPFVERDREAAMLEDRLQRVMSGHGQAVGIGGAAGVGKSRLLQEFRQRLDARAVAYVEGRCAPYGTATPYLPVLEIVQGLFGISEGEGLPGAPYLLHLLNLTPLPGTLASLSPEIVKARTIGALRDAIAARSHVRPVIVAVEDYHWIDAASADVVAALVDGLAAARVLFIATYRPGASPAWLRKPHASQFTVPPLSSAAARSILRAMHADRVLTDELVDAIVGQAGGIPFVIEELTRNALGDRYDDSAGTLPVTVRGALTARVDRLPPAERRVLEAAAVLGHDLSATILRTMLEDLDELAFGGALVRLRAEEFLCEVSATPVSLYTFNHALTQEVLYETLLDEERVALHARAADAISACAPEVAERAPEIVARHLTGARRVREAIAAWHRAGERALGHGAASEALDHVARGLALLAKTPEGPERAGQEIGMQLTLANALVATQGYGAADVEAALRRANDLCGEVAVSAESAPILVGLWRGRLIRAEYGEARRVAEQLCDVAARGAGPRVECQAQFALGIAHFYRAEMAEARRRFEDARRLADRVGAASEDAGQDPRVLSRGYLGISLALLGFAEQAARLADDAIALARDVGHPFALALALHLGCLVRKYRRERDRVADHAAEELAIAREYGFPFWLAGGLFWSGWAQAQQLEEDGLARMDQAIEIHCRTGARMGVPAYLCDFAESCGALGQHERALRAVERGLGLAEASHEVLNVAELRRVRGELLLELAPDDSAKGEAELLAAVQLARHHAQKLAELRAAVSLARYWRGAGRRREAAALLEPLLEWFTEGQALADVRQAAALCARP